MQISISNIAWNVEDDVAVAAVLKKHEIDCIDLAPNKYFPNPVATTTSQIAAVREFWQKRAISIVGMQSLLFGTQGLNVFGEAAVQQQMLDHLTHICRIGSLLTNGKQACKLVFGSPKQRDCSHIKNQADIMPIALDFFQRLGDIARSFDVLICLEPNPAEYGCNFLTHSQAAAEFVRQLGHSNIKMQLDTGTVIMNQESISSLLAHHAHQIGHIHVSEPNLKIVGETEHNQAETRATEHTHPHFAHALAQYKKDAIVCIEMVNQEKQLELTLKNIETSLQFVNRYYR